MKMYKKITRNEINKNEMIALGYCQCQTVLNMFAETYKVGYNSGIYGWNYDLYEIGDCSIVTGYNVPYRAYSDRVKKKKLIALENKIRSMSFSDIEKNRQELKKEFLEIF